jgi:hypothetical protein
MEQFDHKTKDQHKDDRPPDGGDSTINVEAEIEDQLDPLLFTVPADEHFLRAVRARIGATDEMHLFERDHDEPMTETPHGRKAIRIVGHRCRIVLVEVRYEHRTIEHRFAPANTVFKVLQWAVSKRGFGLDPVAAAKANLILPGADTPLPRDAAIGKFAKPGECKLVVDLTLKDFTNG